VDAAVRPGSGFNFTAYLVSSRFAALHEENLLILDEIHPEVKAFLDAARDILRRHFRERREAITADLLSQWRNEGSYPFDGDPADEAESALRNRFDACAMAIRAYSDNFDNFTVLEKKLLFRLMREVLASDPTAATTMLAETLKMPLKKRRELLKT